jgi:hypothetical protein
MYMDGTAAGTSWSGLTTTVSDEITIGARHNTLNTGYGAIYKGYLADLRIYNRVLSANEIYDIAKSWGRDKNYYGLLARWLCGENTTGNVTKLTDYSNSKYDSTVITGTPTYSDEGDILTPRLYGV